MIVGAESTPRELIRVKYGWLVRVSLFLWPHLLRAILNIISSFLKDIEGRIGAGYGASSFLKDIEGRIGAGYGASLAFCMVAEAASCRLVSRRCSGPGASLPHVHVAAILRSWLGPRLLRKGNHHPSAGEGTCRFKTSPLVLPSIIAISSYVLHMHRFVDLPLTFVAAAILSVALAAPSQGHRSAPLVVRSTSGTCKQSTVTVMLMRWKSRVDKLATEVHGTVNATVPGVRQWLAVPYVQPPVGALRWLSPEPLSSNATHHSLDVGTWGPSCIQFEPELTAYNDVLREYFTWGPMSEDCLTASIWAPLHPTKALLPIIIWIHGGGDVFGSANVPAQDPSKWVQRTQSHIVIRWVPTLVQIIANMLILSSICSIQYRLNIFGFPNSEIGRAHV